LLFRLLNQHRCSTLSKWVRYQRIFKSASSSLLHNKAWEKNPFEIQVRNHRLYYLESTGWVKYVKVRFPTLAFVLTKIIKICCIKQSKPAWRTVELISMTSSASGWLTFVSIANFQGTKVNPQVNWTPLTWSGLFRHVKLGLALRVLCPGTFGVYFFLFTMTHLLVVNKLWFT
jgi:hypothetical protein